MDLPRLGFGTYKLTGFDGVTSILSALDLGYRLLDSAVNYENEGCVGAAVRSSSVPREEILLQTKLPGRFHARDLALRCVQESLMRSGVDYLDLYLIHWPNPGQGLYVEAWEALIEARERGWVRQIGVSNFLPAHIDQLISSTGVAPAVNQIEVHPYCSQDRQRAHDATLGTLTQAWSPLNRGQELFTEPAVIAAAEAHQITPGQAVLAWHAAINSIPVPKASSPARQRENLAAMEVRLTADEVTAISALDRPGGSGRGLDPTNHEEF